MPTHDIIDNQEEVLLEHVKNLLRNSVSAKFAVGYFFTSGLTPIECSKYNLAVYHAQQAVEKNKRMETP